MTIDEPTWQPGRRLGGYEIGRLLGTGGMGDVYQAWLTRTTGMRVPVALKVLRSTDEASAERLVEEACIGGLVSHPNVVAALDVGFDGHWYIAMEFVEGVSGAVLMRRGPTPASAALDLVAQAASGLSFLHALPGRFSNLVHGDIKPHNLLVGLDGLVKVADFGVASAHGATGQGTPNYMAPEQWHGHVEQRSDVFGLGVVLWNLLMGRRLFRGGLKSRQTDQVESILTMRNALQRADDLVGGLGDVLKDVLNRDPTCRPSAIEFGDALRRFGLRERGAPLSSLVKADPANTEAPPSPTWFGRVDEIERLSALRDEHAVVQVTGPAGVGKTALLRELSSVDLRLDASTHSSWSAFAASVARTLRVQRQLTEPKAFFDALVRAGHRRVVLDGVDSLGNAFSDILLARPPSVRVVFSGRTRLERYPTLELGPLDAHSARRLYLDRSEFSASDDLLDTILEAVDRLPLAIEWMAASGLPPHDLVHALADPEGVRLTTGGMKGALWTALERTWDGLTSRQQDVLRHLCVFRGRVTMSDALGVLDGVGQLDDILALVDRHAIGARGRRIHVLRTVRAFVRDRGELPAILHERHAAHFARRGLRDALASLKRADGGQRFASLVSIEAELDAALRFAVDERLEFAGPLMLAKLQIVERLGPLGPALEVIDDVLEFLRTPTYRSALLERKARFLERRGQTAVALRVATDAFRQAPSDDDALRADCRLRAGLCLLRLGRIDEALKATRAALKYAEKAGDAPRAGDCHLNLSLVEQTRGETAAGAYHLEIARKLAEENGYLHLLGYVLGNIAQAKGRAGDLRGATVLTEQALHHLEAVQDQLNYPSVRSNLAGLLSERGELEEAARLFSEVVEDARRHGHLSAVSRYCCLHAEILIQLRDFDGARRRIRQAHDIGESFQGNLAVRQLIECHLEVASGRPSVALSLADGLSSMPASLQSYRALYRSQALRGLGRYNDALSCVLASPVFHGERRPLMRGRSLVEAERCRRVLGLPSVEHELEEVRSLIEAHELLPSSMLALEYREAAAERAHET